MKTILAVIVLACLSLPAFGQTCCTTDPATGGTKLISPVAVVPQAGQSPTTQIDLTPETASFPCVVLPTGSKVWRVCAKPGTARSLFVDFGDGTGYHTLQGSPGVTGATGATGAAATVRMGTTTTLSPGSPAVVTNTGSSSAAVFNFAIPKGDPGSKGVDGTNGINGTNGMNGTNGTNGVDGSPATVSVGTTTTLPSGSPATVSNSGTSQNAVFNFGVPAGPAGTATTSGSALPFDATCDVTGWGKDSSGFHVWLHCQ